MTQKRLKEVLDYESSTGIFRWRARSARCVQVGDIAGSPSRDGYVIIGISDKRYRAHRLAWLYVNGRFPSEELDHKNRIRNDNRISNLRESGRSQNAANRSSKRDGLKGASWHRHNKKWRASMTKNYKKIHLGLFDTELEAHLAYVAAAERLHGEFARAA